MKFKKLWFVIFLIVLLLFGFLVIQHGKWDKYYKNKLGQPPRELVVKALELSEKPGKAIDIGFGVGNEAVLLLNADWQVWAIDSQPKAIQILKERKDIKDPGKLVAFVANFEEDSTWEKLPKADFIIASYALPFSNKKNFTNAWNHIQEKLNPGGRFVGHFFGLKYQGFTDQEMKEMTFLTREDVFNLLRDFDIEYFQEIEVDGKSGTGRPTHSHVYEVIARKKG